MQSLQMMSIGPLVSRSLLHSLGSYLDKVNNC